MSICFPPAAANTLQDKLWKWISITSPPSGEKQSTFKSQYVLKLTFIGTFIQKLNANRNKKKLLISGDVFKMISLTVFPLIIHIIILIVLFIWNISFYIYVLPSRHTSTYSFSSSSSQSGSN